MSYAKALDFRKPAGILRRCDNGHTSASQEACHTKRLRCSLCTLAPSVTRVGGLGWVIRPTQARGGQIWRNRDAATPRTSLSRIHITGRGGVGCAVGYIGGQHWTGTTSTTPTLTVNVGAVWWSKVIIGGDRSRSPSLRNKSVNAPRPRVSAPGPTDGAQISFGAEWTSRSFAINTGAWGRSIIA